MTAQASTLFQTLPRETVTFMTWTWGAIEAYFHDLETRELTAETLDGWMADWGVLGLHLDEAYWRFWVATTQDTLDAEAQTRFEQFLEAVYEPAQMAEQRLKDKLLESGLQPALFDEPLRNMRAESAIFAAANLPLLTEEHRLGNEYDRIRSLQTVQWEGEEVTLVQLLTVGMALERERREAAWRLGMARSLQDRAALNVLWAQLMTVRQQIAVNTGLPNYRDYRWIQLHRLDYSPADCETFHAAIEAVVVPAAERALERRRRRLGVEEVRPWDGEPELDGQPSLHPFQSAAELEARGGALLGMIDPALRDYFQLMQSEGLLDLENRKGKMPSSYCASYGIARRPFILMNVVGTNEDVMTLFHEFGHALHTFGFVNLPHHAQHRIGTEFHEVAATTLELLAAPLLADADHGFYTTAEAARARIAHLEGLLRFWPYMAVVDAFQHWAYTHPKDAPNADACDAVWAALWARFMHGEDWSGLDEAMKTGWQRKLHIFRSPFYFIDYGLAQLGAVQIWAKYRLDPQGALRQFQQALALGGTAALPELFAAAGAKLAFDADTLGAAVEVMEATIAELEAQA